jgi:hypothetical protein
MGRFTGLVVAAMLLVAACGGDAALSIEDYFAAVETETARYDQATDDIASAFSAQLDSAFADYSAAATGADEAAAAAGLEALTNVAVDATRTSFELTGVELDESIATMDALEPPDEVADEHEEAVAALRASRAAIDPTIDAINEITTLEELEPVLAGSAFADSRPRLERSCTALEDAGRNNGVETDLDCPGEDEPSP